MTDILIPLMHNGSKYDNLELRYCLRSIEKHLKDYGNIFIIGEKPEWIKNVIHIPYVDSINNWQRSWNIYRKIMAGINYTVKVINEIDLKEISITESGFEAGYNIMESQIIELSDNFLFMNDDHYLLTDYVAGEFPYYYREEISLNSFINNPPQFKQYQNTMKLSLDTCFDFDVHCPILYNKELFKKMFEGLLWKEYGYAIKSVYCNKMLEITNWVSCEDLKFKERITQKESIYQALEGRSWFSIGDRALLDGAMQEVLQELYPEPSKYEI